MSGANPAAALLSVLEPFALRLPLTGGQGSPAPLRFATPEHFSFIQM